MPTSLHPSLRSRIHSILKTALERESFSFGDLDHDELRTGVRDFLKALPADAREQFIRAAGEDGLTSLMGSLLNEKFGEAIDRNFEGYLRDLPGFDPHELAEEFLKFFESLPKKYCVTFAFPRFMANAMFKGGIPAYVGENFALVGSWHEERQNFPLVERTHHSVHDVGLTENDVVIIDTYYVHLHIFVHGIVKEGVQTETPAMAVQVLRSFFGQCIAAKVFSNAGYGHGPYYPELRIFGDSSAGAGLVSKFSLASNDVDYLRQLRVPKDFGGIENFTRVLELVDGKHRSANLNLAAKWYFEGLTNPDEVMSFMQLAIVVEILLGGDKAEDIGLTEVLANRAAYMLATSSEDRSARIEFFRKIYKTRSKIVHNGISGLGLEERKQLKILRSLCAEVLNKEGLLHEASTRRNTPVEPF
ncbi:HEPN domain-containing protein [Variovorax atrisoli]|uniref:HEPN domain-containing protein n=1 Tax=Variovorax atrisoli TaxID=3394203 RepID=UPI00161D831A|nr:HEPN domain-containing protein [Variovorax sp. BK613]MBB3642602.1 hypothetical protein [Variovorax sp. BK613]